YLSRLAPGGALVFHLSNRYVDLEPVLASLVRDAGLVARIRFAPGALGHLTDASSWAVVARRDEDLRALRLKSTWSALRDDGDPVWSDEFSNLLSAMRMFRR